MPASVFSIVLGVGAVAALAILERRKPLRRSTQAPWPRTRQNIAMGILSAAVVALTEQPISARIAQTNQEKRRGIANWLPRPLGPLTAFLIMDYGFYLWHVATHKWPFLWRLHRIHHRDRDLDASTALRFHFVDMLVSMPWQILRVRFSGIGPQTLAGWRKFFLASILFHHSNLRLPPAWDRRLSWFITTPRMHGIHHSRAPSERESNWSSGISLWDYLHGTKHRDIPQTRIRIGTD
jgi:sterol desaturase/sphingolipid hydroxylase (fatty acid hydroxylase superfamily)